jgi:lysophospholipase L1-like esterase
MVTSFRGLPGRIPYASLALAAASADSSPMRSKCHFRGSLHRTYESSCVLGAAVKPDFIVYADSHGAELSVALGKLAEQRGQSVRELTASGCAPTVGFLRGDDPKCAAYNTKMLKKLVSIPATTIVVTAIAAAWSEVAAATYLPGLQTIVHGLRGAGHRVILLGSVPQHPGGVSVPAILARRSAIGEKPADYAFDPDMAHFRAIETALENVATAEHAEYVPVFPTLCDSGRCKAELGGKILYFDYGHLSMAGANLIATDLLAPLLWPTKNLVQAPGTLETQVER